MVQANELRLGNWLQYKDDSGYYKIDSLSREGINLEACNGQLLPMFQFDDFKPIPLSENILLSCGFQQKENLFIKKSQKVTFQLEAAYDEEGHVFFALSFQLNTGMQLNDMDINVPQSFHQLQNLFYSLTGYELEISD